MKTRKFYNYNSESISYEHNNGEVITIPDQSLTVKEILERFRRGTLDYDSLRSNGYYDDDDENIDMAPITIEDITDIEEIARKAASLRKKAADEAQAQAE